MRRIEIALLVMTFVAAGCATTEVTPQPTPDLKRQLRQKNIILSEVNEEQVRKWLKEDPSYQAIAQNCLQLFKGKKLIDGERPDPLEVIMGRYREEIGGEYSRWIPPRMCNDLNALEAAILKAWKERHPDIPATRFEEIVEAVAG